MRCSTLIQILILSPLYVAGRTDFSIKSKLSDLFKPTSAALELKPIANINVNSRSHVHHQQSQALLSTLRVRAGVINNMNRNLNLNRSFNRRKKNEPVPEPVDTNIRKITQKTAVAFGILLALNSGVVNGVCLSGLLSNDGTKQASAAVTGAWTNSALGAASGNYHQFLFNFKCIASYFSGSFMAGFLNPNPIPFEINVISVRGAFLIGSMLLYGSSTLSEEPDKVFIYLAAMANGIQNSLTSTTTGNLVRSTHFSGITSDMGTFMGQVVRGNMVNWVKLKVFLSLAVAFWTGGYVSYSLTQNYGRHVLIFSSILYLILGLAVGCL